MRFSLVSWSIWTLSLAILATLSVTASPTALLARQQNILNTNIGLNKNIITALAGLAKNPTNPGPWIEDLKDNFEQQVDVMEELKPAAGAPQQKDIVDLTVTIIIETVNGVAALPLKILASLNLQLPFLDAAMGNWLKALDSVDPGTSSQTGYSIEQQPDYVHLLQLNLTITLNILGLGNDLEDLGL